MKGGDCDYSKTPLPEDSTWVAYSPVKQPQHRGRRLPRQASCSPSRLMYPRVSAPVRACSSERLSRLAMRFSSSPMSVPK